MQFASTAFGEGPGGESNAFCVASLGVGPVPTPRDDLDSGCHAKAESLCANALRYEP